MTEPILYASETDLDELNKFPTATPDEKAGALRDRSREVDLHLARKGVVTPVTGPSAFLDVLRLIVKYGAAGMLEGVSKPGRAPDRQAAIVASYLDEYKRLLADLDSMSTVELAALGVDLVPVPDRTGATPPGLHIARRTRRCRPAWYQGEFIHKVGHG